MTPSELDAYYNLARQVEVDGDVVECGVYRGESLGAIARALPGRHVWAYDSFQGFPPGAPGLDDEVALGLEGAVVGDEQMVRDAVFPYAEPLTIRAGWFVDTFCEPLPEKIAFLSVDCDLYDSVYLALALLAERVVEGGIIAVDDWGTFIGCRRAVYNYLRMRRRYPVIETFGPIRAAWWRV